MAVVQQKLIIDCVQFTITTGLKYVKTTVLFDKLCFVLFNKKQKFNIFAGIKLLAHIYVMAQLII